MKQAEIDFCEWWLERRRCDGTIEVLTPSAFMTRSDRRVAGVLDLGNLPFPDRGPSWLSWASEYRGGHVRELKLSPRGADLVASYEAALEQGLPIVVDDAVFSGVDYGRTPSRTVIVGPCHECKGEGEIGIPIEYGKQGGILRVWPATCPTCKGARVVEAEPLTDDAPDGNKSAPGR